MDTGWPEKLWTQRQRVIKDLVQGREFATQLQILLHKPFEDHGSVSAKELVMKILRSFTETLSVLSSCESVDRQIPATTHVGSTCSGDRTSQDSGESRKGPPGKDLRGCYKRRKTSDSRVLVSLTMEDGYAWRKYGQKEILNAKYPRCYFRCTHKYDQGCRAIKQVQRMEDDSNMYQSTYFGHHTCRKSQQIISDSEPVEPYTLCLGSKVASKQDHPSCLPITLVKKEYQEEIQSELSDNISSFDSTLWHDLMALESSGPSIMLSPKMGSNLEDVVSTVHSGASTIYHGLDLDMDTLIRSVDSPNDFLFDEIEFF